VLKNKRKTIPLFLLLGAIVVIGTVVLINRQPNEPSPKEGQIIPLADLSAVPPLSLDDLRAVSLETKELLDSELNPIPPIQPGLDWHFIQRNSNPHRVTGRKGRRIEREELYRYMRTYPGDSIPLSARQEAYEHLESQIKRQAGRGMGDKVWQSVGPAPISGENIGQFPIDASGRTTAILVHPQNPDIVYIGGAQGGIWKTTNGGTSWTALSDDQPSLAVGTMTFDPTNPNVIYVGTGEPHSSSDSYYGAGILKTTDGGTSWTQLGANKFAGMGFANIVVDPASNTLIVAASANVIGQMPLQDVPGIYKSTDGGINWTKLASVCNDQGQCTSPSALVMEEGNPNVLYAGFDRVGVLKSTDGGANWTQTFELQKPINRVEVAISPSNSAVLYAGVELVTQQGSLGAIFKSTDSGENWTYLNTLQSSYCGQQCSYDNIVAVHPTNPNIVMAGGQALYSEGVIGIDGTIFQSTDGGASWSYNVGSSESTTIHPDLHAIAFAPSNPNIVWVGNDGGVYRSTDGGNSWQQRNANLGTLQFQSVALHPSDPNILFGGMQDNAKAKTTNGGSSWIGLDVGDGGVAAIDPFDPTYWYGTRFSLSGRAMQFQRNRNSGSTSSEDWPLKNNGIDVNDRVLFYAPLAADPNTAGRVYWGTHRLYRSDDRGENWSAISSDLTKNQSGQSAISNLALLPGNANLILVGTADGNVQLTTNGGANWTDLTQSPLPNRYVSDVAIADAQTMYVSYNGFGANTPTTPGHIYKTTNGGQTWQDISHTGQANGLPDLPALAIALDRDAPGTIYLSTDLGVYSSTDGGNNWAPFNQGLPVVAVFDLQLQSYPSGEKYLVAATHGRSIWRVSLTSSGPSATPTIPPSQVHTVYLPLSLIGSLQTAPTATATPVGASTPTPVPATSTPTSQPPTSTAVATATQGAATATPTSPAAATATQAVATATPTQAAATATPTQVAATATPTQTSGGLPTVENEDFESGPGVGWTGSSTNDSALIYDESTSGGFPTGFTPRSGSWVAWLGGFNDETGDLSQTFTIPTGESVYLHYYFQLRSDEVLCGFDFAGILINETVLEEVTLCSINNVTDWTLASYDMSAYAGQTVTIHFRAVTDDSGLSSFFVDDVSFESSPSTSSTTKTMGQNRD